MGELPDAAEEEEERQRQAARQHSQVAAMRRAAEEGRERWQALQEERALESRLAKYAEEEKRRHDLHLREGLEPLILNGMSKYYCGVPRRCI